MSLSGFIERLIVPPGGCLVLMAVGLVLTRRRFSSKPGLQKAGRVLVVGGLLLALVSSLPWVGVASMRSLETHPIWQPGAGSDAQAIVVLGAGVQGETDEYGGLALGPLSLERVRWAARVHHASGLPVAVTGGTDRPGAVPVAQLMRDALEQDFSVPVRWVEGESGSTWENAANSRQLLALDGVSRVVLVTHAFHMPRAVLAFEKHGLEVTPAPTIFHGVPPTGLDGWIPTASAVRRTSWAAHEWLGRWVYSFRDP